MQNLGVFFFLPALVIVYWLLMFFLKKRPLHKFHRLFLLTLLIYLLALVFCALHFVPGLENNYVVITLFSFFMSIYVPTHYIYIRILTSTRLNPFWCLLNYVPFIILLLSNVFILSSSGNEDFDLVDSVLYGKIENVVVSGLGKVIHLVRVVNISIIIQLFLVMLSSAFLIRKNIMHIPCYDIEVKQRINKTPYLYYLQQMIEMAACSLLTVSLFRTNISQVLIGIVVFILILILYKKGNFMFRQTFFQMPEHKKTVEEMLGENPLVFLCLNPDGTMNEDSFVQKEDATASQKENIKDDNIETNDEIEDDEEQLVDNSSQSKIGARLREEVVMRVEKEEMYLNPDISLNSLAEKLYTNRTYLSQSIIYYKKMNFSSWIKKLRIEYAVKIMSEAEDKVDISNLATQSGYKNLSSFYHDFQSIMGIAPRQFINSKNKNDILK